MKGGINNCAPRTTNSSDILKPLSAMMTSPCLIQSRNPDFDVISLSEIRPPQACDMNDMDPVGVIPINTLPMFTLVYLSLLVFTYVDSCLPMSTTCLLVVYLFTTVC